MGFLKFLKREKKEGLEELDLPPAPPPLEGFDENADFGLPAFEENIPAQELGKFELPEERIPEFGKEEPEFPSFPELEEKDVPFPTISATAIPEPMPPTQAVPEAKEAVKEEQAMPSDAFPKIERRLFRQEEKKSREISSRKEMYVRVDKFKADLQNIGIIRGNLRKSEEAVMKLENIKNAKDRSFDKVKSSLDDLQKKLIFVDKTLFKGE